MAQKTQIGPKKDNYTISTAEDFRPSEQGFGFANWYPGLPLIGRLTRKTSPGDGDKQAGTFHGLCGGMCFAVLDLIAAGHTPPARKTTPETGSLLYRYIFRRQLDSFGPGWWFILKYALWMILPDGGPRGVWQRTLLEFDAVKELLEKGEKIVLGLMYNSIRQTVAIWQNHQVLAYHIELLTSDLWAILIYDPNRPGDDTGHLLVRRVQLGQWHGGEVYGMQCLQRSERYQDKLVRGIFPMLTYTPKTPPAAFFDNQASIINGDFR